MRQEARRAVAAQMRHDHTVALRRQQRGDVDKAVNVVGPAVQQEDCRSIGGAGFRVPDVQHSRVDLLQRAERRARPRQPRAFLLLSLAALTRRSSGSTRPPTFASSSKAHHGPCITGALRHARTGGRNGSAIESVEPRAGRIRRGIIQL